MIKLIFYSILISLVLTGCGSESTSETSQEAPTEGPAPPKVSENDLFSRLSAELIVEPKTQKEHDQNAIVNYALDHQLDLRRTRTGLFYQVIREGEGASLKWGEKAKAHYKGSLLNGAVFDSSYDRGAPMAFMVGRMIQGWNEGVQMLKPGGKGLFLIPSHLGYGDQPIIDKGKEIIPANSVLIFEVELVEKM